MKITIRPSITVVFSIVIFCCHSRQNVFGATTNLRTSRSAVSAIVGDNSSSSPVNNNNKCSSALQFFQMKNITGPMPVDGGTPPLAEGKLCGGVCCSNSIEGQLKILGQKDFASLLQHNSRSLQGLLSFTAATMQNHVVELSHQSQNKTSLLFTQIYKNMAYVSRAPIETFYNHIRGQMLDTDNHGRDEHTAGLSRVSSENSTGIKMAVNTFFEHIFPLVYHQILLHNTAHRDFSSSYKKCLRNSVNIIMPFGDIAKQLGQSLTHGVYAMRTLLHAFAVGAQVLNATDDLLVRGGGAIDAQACYDGLVRMIYCPRCQGVTNAAKPCAGYCLNVLRGCLAHYVNELDAPWNGYVDALEAFVNAFRRNNFNSLNGGGATGTESRMDVTVGRGTNVDVVLRSLDTRISEAIMHAMVKGQDIDNRVKSNCGPAEYVPEPTSEDGSATVDNNGLNILTTNQVDSANSARLRTTNSRLFSVMPDIQLAHFLASIAKSKGFYANLVNNVCQDHTFVEPKDQHCWNGQRIAEYTHTVVDVGLDMQKYNPEVKPLEPLHQHAADSVLANLADKLRQVHHMATVSTGTDFESDYGRMQRDGGIDGGGSGSGAGPDFDGDGDDDEYSRGSGSGNGPHISEDGNEGRRLPNLHITPDQNTPHLNNIDGTSTGLASPTNRLWSGTMLLSFLVVTVLPLILCDNGFH